VYSNENIQHLGLLFNSREDVGYYRQSLRLKKQVCNVFETEDSSQAYSMIHMGAHSDPAGIPT